MRRATPLSALLCAVLFSGCAVQVNRAAFGRGVAAYQPAAEMRGALITIDVARPAHVAVVGIAAPRPGFEYAPIKFEAVFPFSDIDPTYHEAGRHRLRPRLVGGRTYRECREAEKPSLSDCRRTYLPNTNVPGAYEGLGEQHYIVVFSEEPVDPYTLAYELFLTGLVDDDFNAAITRREPGATTDEVERALRPHIAIGWAAVHVHRR
jgi:hypothetical protein